jgi:hypothetical protein
MAGKLWTRDETLVAFNLYCRTPFGRLHARSPESSTSPPLSAIHRPAVS